MQHASNCVLLPKQTHSLTLQKERPHCALLSCLADTGGGVGKELAIPDLELGHLLRTGYDKVLHAHDPTCARHLQFHCPGRKEPFPWGSSASATCCPSAGLMLCSTVLLRPLCVSVSICSLHRKHSVTRKAHLQVLRSCPVKAALEEGGPVAVEQQRCARVQGHVCGSECTPCRGACAQAETHSFMLRTQCSRTHL